jgi:Sap, sulfolipid-1-addressing protein
MPAEAVSLALAASIYPPALAAVIALGRGVEVRLRVVLFVVAAYCTVLVTGALMLFLFAELHVAREQVITPTAALYLAGGCALLVVAVRLRRGRGGARPSRATPSRADRYLQSRRLVLALGFVLYVVPSPIFAAAVKTIADAHATSGEQLVYLVQMLLIMLWLIELPMLVLIAFPARGQAALEATNAWFGQHGRALLVLVAGGVGVYLIAVGAAQLAAQS